MGPLQEWLEALELNQFRERFLGSQPLAGSGAARAAAQSCTWKQLDAVLKSEPSDVLVVSLSQLIDLDPPRSLRGLDALFRSGVGLALRSPERYSAPIATLCGAFARDLPGEQRVIIFATPAGTHGFGWHYDAEDVFVVQTEGDKEYFFRRNSIVLSPERASQPDFTTYGLETTPLMSCRLLAGDWLYLPRGYWHFARAHSHSLSLSIGVFPE
jgi:50S ribosomal protein L16 3-hydroxylase